MPKELSGAQHAAAAPWCRANRCCLRLAYEMVVEEVSPAEVKGCLNFCPVSGQREGTERNQEAIDDLAGKLGLTVAN